MKKFIALTLILLVFWAASVFAQTIPDVKGGQVTVPWNDFKALLEKLQGPQLPADPPPPVDYTLGRGVLAGTLDGGRLELTAAYPFSVLKKGWVVCPLVGTSAPVADILLDGKTAPVTDDGGYISLVVQGPSTHVLTLRFRAAAAMRPGPGTVSMALPRAAGQVLTLKVGDKLSGVTVDKATMSKDNSGQVTAILTGDNLSISYAVASEKSEEKQEVLPPKVLVENSTLVSIDEGFIRAVVQLAYEVRHAPVTAFSLSIPEGFDVADCTGASLVGWKLDEAGRILSATVGFDVKGNYALTVVLERSTKQESFSFPLPAVAAQGVERERGFFAVQVTGGVEVTSGDEIKGLQMVDVKELPSGLRGGATNPIVLAYKYLRHPFSAELKVVRHKTQPVLSAAIDSANYVVQVTEDGDCVTRAVYTVRNNRKQFLEVTLPEDEKIALWSSFVADKPVKPSKTKEGKILLPLEKSSYEGSELQSFTVEIIYYSNLGARLHPMGAVSLNMPELDLPVSKSMLSVYAPGRLKYERYGGTMREGYAYVSPVTGLGFLGKGEMAPAPMESMEKIAMDDEYRAGKQEPKKKMSMRSGLAQVAIAQKEAEEVFQTRIRAAQNVQDSSGSLPARFLVPQEGVMMRFQELITIGEASTVKLLYASRKFVALLGMLSLLIAAALAWFATQLLSGDRFNGKGRKLFFAGAAAILVLSFIGAGVSNAIYGVFIGFGARFVRWVAIQIMKQRTGVNT